MNSFHYVVGIVVLAMAVAFSASSAEPPGNDAMSGLVEGNNAFALDLYSRLGAAGAGRNLFFSPYSISTCLAMTYAGAKGETAKEMGKVLHFPADRDMAHASFGQLQRQLNEIQKSQGVELNVANGLWAQDGHAFLPAFLETAQNDYEAKLKQVDFRTAAEPTRQEINDWVADKTKGKIKDLIGPGMLNALSQLVLVNAIYFKGHWTAQFSTNATVNAPFHASGARDIQVRMMGLSGKEFKYAEPEGLQLLELPYADGALSMVVLLPRENDGLAKLEVLLSTAKLNEWLHLAQRQKVNVFLPRFKLETSFRLDPTLSAMGMAGAFGRNSDFSGMDGARDLYLSAVVHKAFVDVNEEGTEAAAATGAVMAMRAMRPKPIPIFRADHPFVFLIRENASGSILFLGRLAEPAAVQ
jgi:serine protease inhibitor